MTVIPAGESIRNAVKWISETRRQHPEKPIEALIQEASITFDLTPKDANFLSLFYQKEGR